NYLLNIGPGPDGRLEPAAVERLEQIGGWLAVNGRGIYDTRPGPFPSGDWGVSTRRGNTIYIHVLQPRPTLSLPPLPRRITGASLLTGDLVPMKQTARGVELEIPQAAFDGIDAVIELSLEGQPNR